jgi:hypothetical protein
MPHTSRIISPWIGSGNPDTFQEASSSVPGSFAPYAPGDLGGVYEQGDRGYQKVQCDSGATAATPTGVVAANQLAYWKNKAAYRVTNDPRFAVGGSTAAPNEVAGIFRAAITAGNQCFVLQRGRAINVVSDGSGGVGQRAVALATGTNQVITVALGTALTYQGVGTYTATPIATVAIVDVDIPNIP